MANRIWTSSIDGKGRLARKTVLAVILALSVTMGCTVEQTREAEAPDLDVDFDPGQLPAWDIDGPDVNVGVTETTVTVPKLVLVQEEEEVSVPYIDIDVPGADRERRTVTVELEVPEGGHDLEIQEIYAKGDTLWVISRLEDQGTATKGTTRIADRVVLSAPEDVQVRHYVVGQRPVGSHNEQYRFVSSRAEIPSDVTAATRLYSRSETAGQA